MNVPARFTLLGAIMALIGLSGCAETQLAVHTAKKIAGDTPQSVGHYKVGKPYKIKGVWYYPAVDYKYSETGIASWYGPNFHGRPTANGERFDMNLVSAAHRTLPLPSVVRVINLRNGRAITVRVNDRGPFAHGRIIDMSRRAAQLLGFKRAGTTTVKVEILPEESRLAALQAQGKGGTTKIASAPTRKVKVASLPGAPPPASPPVLPTAERTKPVEFEPITPEKTVVNKVPVQSDGNIFIQAGAFLHQSRAFEVRGRLNLYGPARVVPANVGSQKFYRVRIGPLASVDESDRVLDQLINSGYPDARIVVD